jgi:hypothetical protein
MKDDELYPYYLNDIEIKVSSGRMTIGAGSLYKISLFSFNEYKRMFTNNNGFRKRQIDLFKLELRDKKIKDLFNGIN